MIGNIAQFWRLTRELDLSSIREDFERTPTVRVLGSDPGSAERMARLLASEAVGREIVAGTLGEWEMGAWERQAPTDLFVVAVGSPLEGSARRALSELSVGHVPLLLAQLGDASNMLVVGVPEERMITLSAELDEGTARSQLITALVRLAPQVMLPLGRRYPHVRRAVADHLILDTARVNAQFAAVSSLPANIPLVGGVVGDMADMLVLTKNQVLLVFKLAGLYGRDLSLGLRAIAEVIPVVGGAFFWRTTARTLVGLLPSIVSLVPKAVVAYTGTFAVGELARYYYEYGRKAPPELVRDIGERGLRLARGSLLRRGHRRDRD